MYIVYMFKYNIYTYCILHSWLTGCGNDDGGVLFNKPAHLILNARANYTLQFTLCFIWLEYNMYIHILCVYVTLYTINDDDTFWLRIYIIHTIHMYNVYACILLTNYRDDDDYDDALLCLIFTSLTVFIKRT